MSLKPIKLKKCYNCGEDPVKGKKVSNVPKGKKVKVLTEVELAKKKALDSLVKLKPAVKTKWVKALRSGKYKQTQGCLAAQTENQKVPRFCCLGVLTDLYAKEHGLQWYRPEGVEELYLDEEKSTLPAAVQKWAGIATCDPAVFIPKPIVDYDKDLSNYSGYKRELSELNDDEGLSFKKIATLIDNSL
jgi:hypothetical protein